MVTLIVISSYPAKHRASDLIRLLHGALGAGAGGPVTAYLGQSSQVEKSMVTIGGLMQKVGQATDLSRGHHVAASMAVCQP